MNQHFVVYTHPSRMRSIAVEYDTNLFPTVYPYESIDWIQSQHFIVDTVHKRENILNYLTTLNIDIVTNR